MQNNVLFSEKRLKQLIINYTYFSHTYEYIMLTVVVAITTKITTYICFDIFT